MKIGDEVIILFETLGYTLNGILEELDESRHYAKISMFGGSTYAGVYTEMKERSILI